MRLNILHSAVLGLAGFRAADATSGASTIASTTLIALETTSSDFASESSVLSSTIVSASTKATTGVDTATTDATTTKVDTNTIEATSITIVSASTEVSSKSELAATTQTTASAETAASSGTTSITDTTTAPTSIYTTTTTEAVTTTTAELPVITDFQIRGERAPVEGASIYSNRVKGNYLLFSGGSPGYTPATFSVEAISGRLLIDSSLAVCAFFRPDQDIASLSICSDPLESQEVPISCTPPAKDGDVLSCSVPAQTCVQDQISFFEYTTTCTPTGEMLTDTSTDFNYNINQDIPVMGQIANGVNFVVHAV
ncbi:hypothetical protein BKA59DRAFT_528642 [Fusarium tricinctum]|uniref:Uncharacterized protein n=1 Tax=Fusarium tricinctum TaxID=61284 RepID=A0A8K0RZD6_9HYPO|nr:hypothetical protein BKA59DRAFT_528642 [Fusarium tricinctum]